ncbi:TPA: tRNA1(Val) (adenine(37)-N6)-methyltransferase [Photobacterium damselae]
MSSGFTLKQFHVNHGGCGMPVSTDGILLGAWAKLEQTQPILDIGTGSGLLALMAAQRTCDASITAIELDPTAALVAKDNFGHSPWSARLSCIEANLIHWFPTISKQTFGSIVCNPPYFNFGQQAQQGQRAQARHTDTLSHSTLLQALKHLLADNGQASLILPTYEGEQLIKAATDYGLSCCRLCRVQSTAQKPIFRLLMAFTASENRNCEETTLCIHDRNGYSAEFIALTQSFYLNM